MINYPPRIYNSRRAVYKFDNTVKSILYRTYEMFGVIPTKKFLRSYKGDQALLYIALCCERKGLDFESLMELIDSVHRNAQMLKQLFPCPISRKGD